MLRATSWICLSLMLAGWLLGVPQAFAQKSDKNDPAREIHDEVGLFSQQAIKAANAEIAHIKSTYHLDVLVETRDKGPDDRDEYQKFAARQAKEYRVEGIYILITKHPARYEIEVGKATMNRGMFSIDDQRHLEEIIKTNYKKKEYDELLNQSLDYIRTTFKANAGAKIVPPPAIPPNQGGAPPVEQRGDGGHDRAAAGFLGSIGGIICLALGAIVVIWVIFGLIRSMSGGYGGGYGGGGYGGGYGGGGFFPGLMGGMFGAWAGMWMYDTFYGGHGHSSTYAGGGGAQSSGSADGGAKPDPTDVASGYSGAGGDLDEGAGGRGVGGDLDEGAGGDGGGGGGGDWGGGGNDAGGGDGGGGGGGDWGGGGNDAGGDGGGGGGDWGGGGGGDGGGGGGDWGGGGGGGDFGGGGGGDFGGGGGGGGGDW